MKITVRILPETSTLCSELASNIRILISVFTTSSMTHVTQDQAMLKLKLGKLGSPFSQLPSYTRSRLSLHQNTQG